MGHGALSPHHFWKKRMSDENPDYCGTIEATPAGKIIVHFINVGSMILKNPFVKVKATEEFSVVAKYLRKQLRIKSGDSLFLYINAAFAPAPDESVGNLARCFGTGGKLVVNYSNSPAYG